MKNKFRISLSRRALLLVSLVLIILVNATDAIAAETAESIFQAVSAKLVKAKTVVASFYYSGEGVPAKGVIKGKGMKFSLVSDAVSSWYDGKNLYQYSPITAETTLTKPNKSELLETNPLLYLSASSAFKAVFAKKQVKGRKCLVLIPKTKNSGVKNVQVELDAKTLLPLNIKVNPTSGKSLNVKLTKITLNTSISDSEFVYPKSKYKHIKVIDLR